MFSGQVVVSSYFLKYARLAAQLKSVDRIKLIDVGDTVTRDGNRYLLAGNIISFKTNIGVDIYRNAWAEMGNPCRYTHEISIRRLFEVTCHLFLRVAFGTTRCFQTNSFIISVKLGVRTKSENELPHTRLIYRPL